MGNAGYVFSSVQDQSVLRYPPVSWEFISHLIGGVTFVFAGALVQTVASLLAGTASSDFFPAVMLDSLQLQAGAWSKYLLTNGIWWFAPAISVVAFLLPGALSASEEKSPLSGSSLRRHYANISRIVSATSIAVLIYVFVGADYEDPSTAVQLFLFCVATLVITLVGALISSHEGHDVLESLRNAKKQAEDNLRLRKKALSVSKRKEGEVRWAVIRALGVGVVELIVFPALMLVVFAVPGSLGIVDEMQAAVIIVGWLYSSMLTAASAGISVTAGFNPAVIFVVRSLVSLVLGFCIGLFWALAFVSDPDQRPVLFSIVVGTVTLLYVLLVVGYSSWLTRTSNKAFLRFTSPGTVLIAMAQYAKWRVDVLTGKIAAEECERRRKLAGERGSGLILPGHE